MSRVPVFLGTSSLLGRAVRDVLRDWSAAGLLRPYVWIDAADNETTRPGLGLPADYVRDGVVSRSPLGNHLTDRDDSGQVRLCAVSTVTAEASLYDQRAAGAVLVELGNIGMDVSALHVLVVRTGQSPLPPQSAWFRWHNVLVSPEDSLHPRRGSAAAEFRGSDHSGEFARHAASSLAGIAGVWAGVDEGPFDALPVPGQSEIVVARSFLRRVDASAVEQGLRDTLTDVSHGLPRPSGSGRTYRYYENPTRAAATMAERVLRRPANAQLFARPRKSPPPPLDEEIGAWKLIKLFASFMWAALKAAPRIWIDTIRVRTSAAVARRVHDAVFAGHETRYRVVVLGVTESGAPAGLSDIRRVADEIDAALQGTGTAGESGLPSLDRFWDDVADGALTLVDGANHDPELPAPLVDDLPGVVRFPGDIAPSPHTFYELPADVAKVAGTDRVVSYDVRAAQQVAARLHGAAERADGSSSGAASARDALMAFCRPHHTSYLGGIGAVLARELSRSEQDVRTFAAELAKQAEDTDDAADMQDEARSVARRMLVTLGLAALVVIALVVLGSMGRLEWLLVVPLAVLALVLWFVGSVIDFWRRLLSRYRDDFARAAARERDEAALEALKENLRRAAFELRLHSTLYAQYLAWSPILGTFVAEPFGRQVETTHTQLRLGGALPRAMGLGTALPQRDKIKDVAASLSLRLFEPGWSGRVWEAHVGDAINRLAEVGMPVEARDVLFGDPSPTAQSPLVRWSEEVREHGIWGSAASTVWAGARTALLDRGLPELTRTLLTEVDVIGHDQYADAGRRSGEQFLGELTRASFASRPLARSVFSDRAWVDGGAAVRTTVFITAADVLSDAGPTADEVKIRRIEPAARQSVNLDQFAVVVQTSSSVPEGEIQLVTDRSGESAEPGSPGQPADDESAPDDLFGL